MISHSLLPWDEFERFESFLRLLALGLRRGGRRLPWDGPVFRSYTFTLKAKEVRP